MQDPAKRPLDGTRLNRWIVECATSGDDGRLLLDGLCRALVEAGLPLWRASIGTPALTPLARGFNLDWYADAGVTLKLDPHEAEHTAAWTRSPIYVLMARGERAGRWRLDALGPEDDLPLLRRLRERGATDYVLRLMPLAPETRISGVGVSFATSRPGGFTEDEIAALESFLPVLGLGIGNQRLTTTLRDVLATYLGRVAGARVLDGEIRRGQGSRVSAAILLTDLRGFTSLSDRADPIDVVGWLDEHFDALGEPVLRHGGEILKFLGDGFLAAFPVDDPAARPCTVCERALDAAADALRANARLNARRRARGLPELAADLVLHFGEVVYGNVGTSERLDFTVIGRAVNEASRIEGQCEALGRALLISDSFAERCGRPLLEAGTVALRGLASRQRVWTLPESGSDA